MLQRTHHRILKTFFFLLAVSLPVQAGWQEVGRSVAEPPQGNQITFHSPQATAVISVLAPDLVRVRIGLGTALGPDYSWAVIKTDWPQAQVEFSADKTTRTLRTSEVMVRVQLAPFRIAFYDSSGNLISKDDDLLGVAWNGARVRCSKWMPPDEHYFGLGEKTGPLDKRGHSYVMWNTDPSGYDALTDPMYQDVPFFIGLRQAKAYGIFFDNTYRSTFDLGAESSDSYSFAAEGGEMNYYFFYGPDPKKIIARYTELVGRTPLPPRWSLGYIQSSAYYYPESTVRFVAENFRFRHIPCDAIFLDTAHMNESRIFTWDKAGFPDPPKLLGDLRQKGFHVFAIVDPGAKAEQHYYVYDQGIAGDYFLKRKNGKVYTGEIWPGESAFPDFTSEKTRAWWGSLAGNFAQAGLSGYLTDMDEPTVNGLPPAKGWAPRALDPDVIHYDHGLNSSDAKNHNVYGMLMSRATREGMIAAQPNERPFVITRATYAGGQRYAAQWTGDNLATWEDLRASLRLIQSMGISGLVFSGSDTGGFINVPSPELYARWMEAGVFHPFFWTHGGGREPTVDPWSFGQQVEDISRRLIELRYRLLPYLYTAFYQSTQTGIPIVRPLALEFPDDPTGFDETPDRQYYEYLFGEDLLVAPVVNSGETRRRVYLPRGTWFDFWSDHIYRGPATITVDAPLDFIPIFARGGAIVPMQQVVEFTGQAAINPLSFEIYPDGKSSRFYYEDDGISFDYQRGSHLLQNVNVDERSSEIRLTLSAREGNYTPPDRSIIFKIHGLTRFPQAIQVDGRSLEVSSDARNLAKAAEGAAYDAEARVAWIKLADRGTGFEALVQK